MRARLSACRGGGARPHPPARPTRGVTLIEILISVAVLALVLMAGVPAFGSWLANLRVRNAADSLQNGLRLAQAEAIRRNAGVTLTLTTDSNPGATASASSTGLNWAITDTAGRLIQTKGLEGQRGVTMSLLNADGSAASGFGGQVVWSGLGRNQLAASLQFHLTAPGADHPLRVWLSPAGRVRLCDPARSSGDAQACE